MSIMVLLIRPFKKIRLHPVIMLHCAAFAGWVTLCRFYFQAHPIGLKFVASACLHCTLLSFACRYLPAATWDCNFRERLHPSSHQHLGHCHGESIIWNNMLTHTLCPCEMNKLKIKLKALKRWVNVLILNLSYYDLG